MDDDYYSIDSILAENQKVHCTFKVNVPEMGHLAGGNERDIKVDSKIAVPIWMASILIVSSFADFTIPTPFSARVRGALNAEARSVRLSNLIGAGGFWYGFGRMLMRLMDDQYATEMSNLFTTTFKARLVEVIDQAQHFAALGPSSGAGASGDMTAMFREGLDATERELFALAQASAKQTKKWYETSDRGRR